MTSVKELSQKLNISKMRLYQIINELSEAEKPIKSGNRYVFTDDNIKAIKNKFEKTTYNLNKFSKEKSTDNLILELKKQIENYNQQLKTKDDQIQQLTKLVDQSQQLQLVAQKQLESKTKEADDAAAEVKQVKEAQAKAEETKKTNDPKADEETQPKHWWQRF